ncbi:MAG TPA: glycosyltransferase family 39 protein [Solirubrobacteraceae bacterium]
MATYASRRPWALRARALTGARAGVAASAAGVGLIVAASLLVRAHHLGVGYWIDEGLSVGIADRPLLDIPGTLRLDGSPPLYYMLLHVWLGITGSSSESATAALSLLFACLAVPVAFVGTRRLFGARAGWIAAALTALNPFLTQYSQETRMYALVVLLGTVATAAFVAAFVMRRRAALPVLAVALAAMVYTHNYALFFTAATGLTWLGLVALAPPEERRALLRDGLIAYGAVAVLYAAWLPTLLFQTAHTGAPWAERPALSELIDAPSKLLGEVEQIALLLAAGTGLARVLSRRRLDEEARAAVALTAVAVLTLLLAWLASQVSPAWAMRYLAVGLPPLLLLAAFGLARAERLGLVGLAVVALFWAGFTGPDEKSNVRTVAGSLTPSLRSGDLVISTWPEQIPVLSHYLPPGLRYATLWGSVDDLGVTDWRDGVTRLEQTSAPVNLRPLLDALPEGHRVVLVQPIVYGLQRWSSPWTGLVRVRSEEWSRAILDDPRFHVSAIYPPSPYPSHPNAVKATVLLKRGR